VRLGERAKPNNGWSLGDHIGHSLAHVQLFCIYNWLGPRGLVNFSINLTTCLPLCLLNWTFQGGPAGPGFGPHYPHCAAASCYFGKGLVISLRSPLFPTPRYLLLKCLSHSKWSRLCHCSSYSTNLTTYNSQFGLLKKILPQVKWVLNPEPGCLSGSCGFRAARRVCAWGSLLAPSEQGWQHLCMGSDEPNPCVWLVCQEWSLLRVYLSFCVSLSLTLTCPWSSQPAPALPCWGSTPICGNQNTCIVEGSMLIFESQEAWGLEMKLPRPWVALIVDRISLQSHVLILRVSLSCFYERIADWVIVTETQWAKKSYLPLELL
jgi:hypothetical protein